MIVGGDGDDDDGDGDNEDEDIDEARLFDDDDEIAVVEAVSVDVTSAPFPPLLAKLCGFAAVKCCNIIIFKVFFF